MDKILVSEEDIINTYLNKTNKLTQLYYQTQKIRKEQNIGSIRISKLLNCSEHLPKNWLYFNRKPYPIKAIDNLKKLNLIPLTINSTPKFKLLIKLLSYIYGDGSLSSTNFRISLAGQKEDLIVFQKEINKILNIKGIIRKASGQGIGYELRVYKSNIGRLLYCMGAPLDDKLVNQFKIPNFIINNNKEIKQIFLDTLFSNELSSPRLNKQNCFSALELSMWKSEDYINSLYNFMTQIKELLNEFNIQSKVFIYQNQKYKRKRDNKIIRPCILRILNNKQNLYKFLTYFKFSLCKRKFKARNKILKELKRRIT